jgi:hypothetical protein
MYQAPSIETIHPMLGPSRGGTQVTLTGAYLEGTTLLQPIITLTTMDSNDGSDSSSSTRCKVVATTARSIQCVTENHLTAGVAEVVVTIDDISSVKSEASTYEFLPPKVDTIVPSVLPTYGSTPIDVTGKFFVSIQINYRS